MLDFQTRSKIHPKQHVKVAVKVNGEYQEELVEGVVDKILTNSETHYRGIKVMLQDGTVGRVKEIVPYKKAVKNLDQESATKMIKMIFH